MIGVTSRWDPFDESVSASFGGIRVRTVRDRRPYRWVADLRIIAAKHSGKDPILSARLWEEFVRHAKATRSWPFVTTRNAAERFGKWCVDHARVSAEFTQGSAARNLTPEEREKMRQKVMGKNGEKPQGQPSGGRSEHRGADRGDGPS